MNSNTRLVQSNGLFPLDGHTTSARSDLFGYILDWLAHVVQKPHEKPGVALVLRGTEGIGKSLFTGLISRIVGTGNTIISASGQQVVGRFNGHLMNKLLIIGEEAFFAGDPRQTGPLKSLITDSPMSYEFKGVNVTMEPSYHRVILNTNEKWAVPTIGNNLVVRIRQIEPARCRCKFENTASAQYVGGSAGGTHPFSSYH